MLFIQKDESQNRQNNTNNSDWDELTNEGMIAENPWRKHEYDTENIWKEISIGQGMWYFISSAKTEAQKFKVCGRLWKWT